MISGLTPPYFQGAESILAMVWPRSKVLGRFWGETLKMWPKLNEIPDAEWGNIPEWSVSNFCW